MRFNIENGDRATALKRYYESLSEGNRAYYERTLDAVLGAIPPQLENLRGLNGNDFGILLSYTEYLYGPEVAYRLMQYYQCARSK